MTHWIFSTVQVETYRLSGALAASSKLMDMVYMAMVYVDKGLHGQWFTWSVVYIDKGLHGQRPCGVDNAIANVYLDHPQRFSFARSCEAGTA
jgi:hypothetical protein